MAFGHIFGGIAEGMGAGMAERARMDYDAEQQSLARRHQMAMENLRSSNSRQEMGVRADYSDRNNARQTERQTNRDLIVNEQQADIRAGEQSRERDWRSTEAARDRSHDRAMESLRASRDEQKIRLADQLDREREAGRIHSTEIAEDGTVMKVMRDGSVESTGFKATPREVLGSSAGGGMGLYERATGGMGTAAGVSGAGTNGTGPTAPATPARPTNNTYTMADARATAEKHGVSVDDVHRVMREQGYKLTN